MSEQVLNLDQMLQDDPVCWTLDEALSLVRALEPLAIVNGYHTALGGSVLHRGQSSKDLDVYVYKHKSTGYNQEKLIDDFTTFGLEAWQYRDHSKYGDDKEMHYTYYKGKRVDIFFL